MLFVFLETQLTLFDDQVGHDERHGVAGVNVVAAVDVLPVDGQAHAGQELEDAPRDLNGRRLVQLRRADVVRVRLRQHSDRHRHGPVVIMNAHK